MAGRKELQIIHHKNVTLYIDERGTKRIPPQQEILLVPRLSLYT